MTAADKQLAQPRMPEEATPEIVATMIECSERFITASRSREQVARAIYRAIHKHLSKPAVRKEWWITGKKANGIVIFDTTATTPAQRDFHVTAAYALPGTERVTIVCREVEA